MELDREREAPGDSVVYEHAVLKQIPTDENEKTLRVERSTDRAGSIDRDGEANDFYRDRVDVLLGGRMGSRGDGYDVDRGQLKLLSRTVVHASGCSSCVDQRETRDRRG